MSPPIRRPAPVLLAATLLFSFISAVGWNSTATAGSSSTAAGACGTRAGSKPLIQHVVWIWEENHSFGQVIGSSNAPYINAVAKACGLATNYRSISHPSAPNYVGATSGLALSGLPPTDCTTHCRQKGSSIFGQTTWRAYQESMPKNCYPYNSGAYVARHNPPTYFSALTNCATDDVPLTDLAQALSAGTLPAFTFITPNLNDDMHDGTVAQGDAWLAKQLPKILASPDYTSGTTAIFVTWDEGSGGGGLKGTNCITSTSASCHVATLVISPYTTPGTVDSVRLSHYALLRTTEELLGLPLLGQAATAPSMAASFGLS
jgi:phosphatidylinositol-3-phosphatase